MMRCSRSLRTIGVVLAIALIAPRARADAPAAAPETAVDEGRLHFQRGVAFYKDRDYRSALVEFQEAYRVAPNYRLMFNIGKTHAELLDFAGALTAFREYLAEGGIEITAARRTEVETDLRRLVGHVASLEIIVNEADATLVAEGDRRVDLGTSPRAQPALLNSGTWTISARKSGFATAEEKVVVGGGEKKTVRLTLAPTVARAIVVETVAPRAASEPDVPPPSGVPESQRPMTAVYAGAAVTVTLAVGAVVTGVLAVRAKSDYDAALTRFGSMPADVSGARTRTRTLALATDVLGGAAIAGAIVTAVLYLVRPPPTKTATPARGATVSFDGLGAHGAF